MTRVYYFTSAQFGLDNLHKRRLKVARLGDLNDPFELLALKVVSRERREALTAWRDHMATISRLLCFSTSWQNPVMWSHYGDKHRGLVLGFDVPEDLLLPVSYEPKRLEAHIEHGIVSGALNDALSKELLTTKFYDWRYESEVRMFLKPDETFSELGLEFYKFSPQLKLREVIIGPRRQLSPEEVGRAIQHEDGQVKVTQTRLAWSIFKVVEDEDL